MGVLGDVSPALVAFVLEGGGELWRTKMHGAPAVDEFVTLPGGPTQYKVEKVAYSFEVYRVNGGGEKLCYPVATVTLSEV